MAVAKDEAVVALTKASPVERCPKCSADLISDYRNGDVLCPACGFVAEERMVDEHSEWRTFTNEGGGANDPNRVGGPSNPLLRDGGLSTTISRVGAGSSSLLKWHDQSTLTGSDRRLLDAFKRIADLSEKMQLPNTISMRAKELYKQIDDRSSLRGRNVDAVVAASTYIACRQEEVPRTFKEFKQYSGVTKKDVAKAYRFMMRTLGTPLHTIGTSDFVNRFCSMLNLPNQVVRAVTEIAQEATRLGFVSGKSPVSVTAAAILVASQLNEKEYHKQIKEIALVTGVSEVTIRNAYKDLFAHRFEIIPEWYAQHDKIEKLAAHARSSGLM